MRAVEPSGTGYVERGGIQLAWEEFGEGPPTIALLPTWSIIDSRFWKFQVPYLARHHRIITFDGRGCGRSDRPRGAASYTHLEFAADTLAVLDATDSDQAVLVAYSCGALWALQVAADRPDRVHGVVAISPAVPLAPMLAERTVHGFDESLASTEGWAKYNRYYWNVDFEDFLSFFFGRLFTEAHSTKAIEDCVRWALDVDPATLIDTTCGLDACGREGIRTTCERVHQPVLVIQGDNDAVRPYAAAVALAEATGGSLVTVKGGGHGPHCRDPILVNHLIKRFIDGIGH